jgi:AraC-like DNA-binding protein
VDRDLHDPGLTAASLGAKLALLERYVQHLTAEAGTSFAQLVRGNRLDLARRLLRDRTMRPRSIADIAYAVGFSDLSTFNRVFRRHFGCTPSDMRRS